MGISSLPGERCMASIIYESGTVLYICKAAVGSSLSDAVWQIKKTDTASGVITTWADGDDSYDNLATNLATVAGLSYS